MKYDPDRHHRRSIRLKGYDYAQAGAYFVTLCVQGRECLFGCVEGDAVRLSAAGEMVAAAWARLPEWFPFVELDEYVVMPNHLHGILVVIRGEEEGDHKDRPNRAPSGTGEPCVRPLRPGTSEPPAFPVRSASHTRPAGTLPGTLGRVMQAFKSTTTHEHVLGVRQLGWPTFFARLWQRDYYDRIVRNERELDAIRRYIRDNPLRWALDRENPTAGLGKNAEPWCI